MSHIATRRRTKLVRSANVPTHGGLRPTACTAVVLVVIVWVDLEDDQLVLIRVRHHEGEQSRRFVIGAQGRSESRWGDELT